MCNYKCPHRDGRSLTITLGLDVEECVRYRYALYVACDKIGFAVHGGPIV